MDRIGKYEVLGVLGQGGMGVVYRAHDPVIAREVAIKLILGRAIDAPAARERFYREARSAGKLSHENIITIYDVGETDGRPFIVMELLDGADLRRLLDALPPPPLDTRLDVAVQVCRGLAYAHARGVVHRDIKPENVQVLSTGRAKILDFGIARVEAETQTLTQGQIGTPRYMSPEQIRGEPLDLRTDVFSFGVMLYEMATGVNPFRGEHVTTVIYKVLHETPPPLSASALGAASSGTGAPVPEGAVRALEGVVRGCLEKEPGRRYGSLEEVASALERTREALRRGGDGAEGRPSEQRSSLWGLFRKKGPAPPPPPSSSPPASARPPAAPGRTTGPAPTREPRPALGASSAGAALDPTVVLAPGAAAFAQPRAPASEAGLETLPLSAYMAAPEADVPEDGATGDSTAAASAPVAAGDAVTMDLAAPGESAPEADEPAAFASPSLGENEGTDAALPADAATSEDTAAEAPEDTSLYEEAPDATRVLTDDDQEAFDGTEADGPLLAAYVGDGDPSSHAEHLASEAALPVEAEDAAPSDAADEEASETVADDAPPAPEEDQATEATVAFDDTPPAPAEPFRATASTRDTADATQALSAPPAPARPPKRPAAPARAAALADEAPPHERRRLPLPLLLIGGLVALVLIGAGVVFLGRPSPSGETVIVEEAAVDETLAALEASARQELQRMAVQRDSAAAAGVSDTPAFQEALRRARAAEAAFARGGEAGFTEAEEAARDAAGRFAAARLEATVSSEDLRQRAEAAERAAEDARRRVFDRRNDPAVAPAFRRADQALAAARSARDEGNLADAARLFAEAERGFREVRTTLDERALQEDARRLRGEAERARDRALPRATAARSLFRQADERLNYGVQRLERGSYGSARTAFQQAIRLYEQVRATPEATTPDEPPPPDPTPTGPTQAEATAAMQSLASQLAGYVRTENISGVQGLHATLGGTWGRFFESFDVVSASASVSGVSVDGERATGSVTVSVQFVPTGGSEQQSSSFSYRWSIVRSGSSWRIVSVQ